MVFPWHFLNFFPLPHGHGSLRSKLRLFFGIAQSDVLISVAIRSIRAAIASLSALVMSEGNVLLSEVRFIV